MLKTKNSLKENYFMVKIILFIFCSLFFSYKSYSQTATPVETDFVISEPLNQSIPVLGRVVSLREGKVPAAVQGKIDKIFVEVGDKVKKKQVLAVIDIELYKWFAHKAKAVVQGALAKVEAAKASIDNATAIINLNKLELDRLEALKSSPAYSVSKHEDLKSKMIALKANESIAKANLNIAKANLSAALQDEKVAIQNLDRAEVKASFDGIIESRKIELGEAVGLGFTLFNLVSDSMFEIEVDVPSNRARILKPFDKLSAKTTDNIKFTAIVRSIGVKENSSTRTLQVRLSFERDTIDRPIFVGENITAFIPIGPGLSATTVHKDAILKREGLSLVYILKDGIAQIKPVELGDGIGNRFVIKRGLNEGDEVVIKGNERLRPGQKISSLNNKKEESD